MGPSQAASLVAGRGGVQRNSAAGLEESRPRAYIAAMDNRSASGLPFMKMHGLGNDFVVIDLRAGGPSGGALPEPALVRRIADRNFGVGFDQLATIQPDADADAKLTFFNADGSISAACGNATRCIARFLLDETGKGSLRLRTDHAVLTAEDAGGAARQGEKARRPVPAPFPEPGGGQRVPVLLGAHRLVPAGQGIRYMSYWQDTAAPFDGSAEGPATGRFDAAVIDPPRAGAPAQAEHLAASRVPVVAWVSCDPVTFARDARVLVDGGFRLERVTPVDQFRYSAHIELVGVFRRASKRGTL